MADLVPPDPGARVAESAAPVKLFPPSISSATSKINAAAHAAYDAIREFRKEVIHDRIKLCINWLQLHMKDFHTLAVEVVGSKCYHLELCTSDVDVVVILGPGQSSKAWLDQLRLRSEASPVFDRQRGWQRRDCFQTSYLGVPVDIKPIRNNRASDGACRSSDSLKLSGRESRDL